MTRRENFLKTLKQEKHERLPAFVVIDDFNYPHYLPGGFDMGKITNFTDPGSMTELSKYYGMDTLIRIVPSPIKEEYESGVNLRTETFENGRSVNIYDTPTGSLRLAREQSNEANTTYISEHPIKQPNDYNIFLEFLQAQKFSLDEKNLVENKRFLEAINEEGIAYVVGPSTPIMELTRIFVGLENFIYHMVDEPELIKTVLDAMSENCYKQYELIARNSPCEVIVFWDDANSLYLSPAMFEQYSVPVIKRYAEIAHRYGKTLVCHTCGSINSFLELFLETGVDAVDWVALSPIGDVDPRHVQEVWGDKITMMLSTVPDVFKNGTPVQVEEHIHSLLKGLDTGRNLVLMIAPPLGTPIENVRRAVKVLTEEYGVPLNRSERFGNILEL